MPTGYAAPPGRSRRRASRRGAASALGAALLLTAAAPAAKTPEPALVSVDLGTGRILEAANLDAPRAPASLAKLMTAFIAFDALEAGAIARDRPVEVSTRAAGQPPVGAGLRPRRRVPFGELLDAALVASANDAAVAVAEAVAGAEKAFVERMNRKAKALGLVNTVFVNASGLPAPGQRITARDAALLAKALLKRHPQRAEVFSKTRISVDGRTLLTTNPLLGAYRGAAGLKTGFTCRAGYNLVALAVDADRRILSVGLTFPSRAARDRALRAQLNRAFSALGQHQAQDQDQRQDRNRAPGRGADGALAPARRDAGAASAAPPVETFPGCGPGGPGSGRPVGYAAFFGAYVDRNSAAAALRIGRRAGAGRGASYLRRRRDRRWAAMLHSLRPSDATRICLAARRSGRYCVRLSPKVLRARRVLWR